MVIRNSLLQLYQYISKKTINIKKINKNIVFTYISFRVKIRM